MWYRFVESSRSLFLELGSSGLPQGAAARSVVPAPSKWGRRLIQIAYRTASAVCSLREKMPWRFVILLGSPYLIFCPERKPA